MRHRSFAVQLMKRLLAQFLPRLRQSLFGWLILWLLAIPLVHIHPESDHRHGTPDHVHGGQFHTLLSKALACEFARYQDAEVAGSSGRSATDDQVGIGPPGHFLEHPGVAFTILVDFRERSDAKFHLDPIVLERTATFHVSPIGRSISRLSSQTVLQGCTPPPRPRGPPVFIL